MSAREAAEGAKVNLAEAQEVENERVAKFEAEAAKRARKNKKGKKGKKGKKVRRVRTREEGGFPRRRFLTDCVLCLLSVSRRTVRLPVTPFTIRSDVCTQCLSKVTIDCFCGEARRHSEM